MAATHYRSLDSAEVVDIEFQRLDGGTRLLKLLVDTGFSGRSSVILSADASELFRASLPATQTSGALKGPQDRAWVTCRIPGLNFQVTLIALVTDITQLSLPVGVDGMVGLSFLRLFARWGAEKIGEDWHFSHCSTASISVHRFRLRRSKKGAWNAA